ncbi:MAG: LysR family transcriptional regulator [Hellea sp.]
MENWENYRLVLALHRAGTIRGAANALNINHATVSRRLAQMNSQSHLPLFEKVTGGYQATELGLTLVAAGEKIEMITVISDRRSRAISANLSGTIRVSMGEPIAQYLLQDELMSFAKNHPKIELSIETSIGLVDLDRSEADIVIRATASPPDHLVGRRLFPFYLCNYCSREYLANTPYEERQWLKYSKSSTAKDWIKHSSHPDAPIALHSDDLIFLLKAAKAGQGMIRTACYMADPVSDLVRLPLAETHEAQDLWILTHPDLRRTKRIQHLMSYLATALEDKRALIQGVI